MIASSKCTTLALILTGCLFATRLPVCCCAPKRTFTSRDIPNELQHRWDTDQKQLRRREKKAEPGHLHLRGGGSSHRMPKAEGFLDSSIELAETEGDVEELLGEEWFGGAVAGIQVLGTVNRCSSRRPHRTFPANLGNISRR